MKRKDFLKVLAGAGLVPPAVVLSCCTKPSAEKRQPVAAAKTKAPAAPAGIVYTRDNPGPWKGKVKAHVPDITFQKTSAGLRVTVTVHHGMDLQKPHYIMWIRLYDGRQKLLGEKRFQPTDPKPEATFTVPSGPSKLVAYERCNIHGVWKNELPLC